MQAPEEAIVQGYEVDYFAVLTLIVLILTIIFLVVSVIYFNSVANLTPPTRAESTFLLWTGVVIIVVLTAMAAYALIRIFFYNLPIITKKQMMVYGDI